jgi:hypothetical protein
MSAFIFDESLHRGPVATYFAEQVIKQCGFSQCTCEQLLRRMRFPAYPPQNRFEGERELTLRTELRMFLFCIMWLIQIDPAVGATHQVMVDVCAAIAALDFIICRGRSNAGRHEKIVSKINAQHRVERLPSTVIPMIFASEYNPFGF